MRTGAVTFVHEFVAAAHLLVKPREQREVRAEDERGEHLFLEPRGMGQGGG